MTLATSEFEFFDRVADTAAAVILPHFRKLDTVSNKLDAGFDPVTVADRAAERAIRDLIERELPGDGIVGEEYPDENRRAERTWIIDPIDGTRAFISGLPVWGTLVGRLDGGKAAVGQLSQGFTGEQFIGDTKSAWFCRAGQRSQIHVRATHALTDAIMLTTTPALFSDTERHAYDQLEDQCRLARYGTDCYAYGMLAAGQVDLVVESGLNVYDIAPLIPIIEGAGGIVTNWTGGRCDEGGQVLAAASEELHVRAMDILHAAADQT